MQWPIFAFQFNQAAKSSITILPFQLQTFVPSPFPGGVCACLCVSAVCGCVCVCVCVCMCASFSIKSSGRCLNNSHGCELQRHWPRPSIKPVMIALGSANVHFVLSPPRQCTVYTQGSCTLGRKLAPHRHTRVRLEENHVLSKASYHNA